MNTATYTLLSLIKTALGKEPHTAYNTNVNWSDVYRLAMRQGVVAIAWEGIQTLINSGVIDSGNAPERALKLQWALAADNIEQRYLKQERLIAKLASFYAEHGISMMVIKGYGLSLLYPTPKHRECSDIDIWLFGEQQRADDLMRKLKGITIDEDDHHHTTFSINGIMVENHYDFINVHAHLSSRKFENILRSVASKESCEKITVDGSTVYLPSANFHALFLLRHAASHFAAAEIALRHVIDWAMFVKSHHDDIDWGWLYDVAKEFNTDKFLNCINAICIDYFDIPADYFPQFERNKELEERVFNDIIQPEFSEKSPSGNLLKSLIFKFRRWWANRWKHRIVYREGLLITFFVQIYSHALKPKSFR